ncbi:MAG: hypothetical protein OXC83_10650 [Chloroflexi bacterium]|nr:hypothetical protein [Chloroflexota bacterium]
MRVPNQEELRRVGNPAIDYYLDHIADQLSNADKGRYIAIDVDTGEWEIDDTEVSADRLRNRLPDAHVYVIRHILVVSDYFMSPRIENSSDVLNSTSHQLAEDHEEFGR